MSWFLVQKYHTADPGYHDGYWETIDSPWVSQELAQRYMREISRIGHDARILRVELVEEIKRGWENKLCGHELIEDQTAWYTDFRHCKQPAGHKGKHSDGRKSWL